MSANALDDILPSAVASHARSVDFLGTQTIFLRAVVTAINTARVTGLFTANGAIGSTSSTDLPWVMDDCIQCGYGATIVSTNLVVTW